MTDAKKESRTPVVVRKGHVKPPAPGSRIEPPVEEALGSETPRPQAQDARPLWQRLAEAKAGGTMGAAAGTPSRPPTDGRPGERRAPRRGEREHAERGRRRDRPGRPQEPEAPRGGGPTSPPARGEPPPAPEAPIPDEGTFADLLAQAEGTSPARRRWESGEKVAGKIIQIGPDVTFLELGSGTADAMIETAELKDETGNVTARVGDVLDAVVVKGGERGVLVSRGHGRTTRDHAREALAEAAHTGLPVEGVVTGVNKGGLEVEVHGQRAFCPVSQIDLKFVGEPASFVGQKLRFKVQRADGRDAVLSRRALLEEERAERARATRARLAPDAVFEGVVTSVQDYGAFVDIGGLEGLVHVSELSWDRVSRPQDLLHPGDPVQVQVLRIEEDPKKGERISLSVKALAPRPEPAPAAPGATPAARPAPPPPPRVGDVVEASVDKVEPFGVFVRFAGGRGLVPASETGTPRGADLRRSFKPGDALRALVTAIDEQGRIRLSRTEAEAAAERAEARAYMESARPHGGSGKGFGTLGDLMRQKMEKK